MTLIYLGIGILICYFLSRREVRYWKREALDQRENNDILCRLNAASIQDIVDLQDQLEDQRMLFSEHRANHVCVEKEDEWPEIVL